MRVTIYHNPRCSKSRAALDLLKGKGVQPEIVEYLKTPPSAEELDSILKMLGKEPRDVMRKNEAEYQEKGLDDMTLSRSALIDAMVKNPKLIERPIVVANGKAALGRPPENVLDIV